MTVAVCCPGPTLPHTWPGRAGYDHVIAVNRALLVVSDADWLVAGDLPMYQGLLGTTRPRVGACALHDTVNTFRREPEWKGMAWKAWPTLGLAEAQLRRRPMNWSIQAALLLAHDLQPGPIDLYGTTVIDGITDDCTNYAGDDRTAERWRREGVDVDTTFALLAEHGSTIRRLS